MSLFAYLAANYAHTLSLLADHVELTAVAVGIAILIGVPLGILISYQRELQGIVLGLANLMQAIPSLALLGFAIPLLGIGRVPAIIVVIIYSLLPIVKNTYTGISQISPETREAAIGIGLSKWQLLTKVEIPLALPVIMAGVRISSVTAVGLMTIAAFIGAGGLGDLVFAGIRTVDNNMILAGAIPACLLALAVDWFLGLVETITTPMSVLLGKNSDRKAVLHKRRIAKTAVACVLSLLVIGGAGSAYRDMTRGSADIVVGSKNYTENILVAHLMSEIIENRTGLDVERRTNLGGTQVAFTSLKNGDIDLYLGYTGTAYVTLLKHAPSPDVKLVYEKSKKELSELYDICMLPQYSFNNTYALAVRPEFAAEHNLETISDLAAIDRSITAGTTFEFKNRPDGINGLLSHYGLHFKDVLGIDDSSRYLALEKGEVQVIDAFTTDGLLKKFNLKVLQDDEQYFPPYYATPVMRQETYDKYPEVVAALNDLGSYLTDSVMQELNYRVDEERQDPKKVARDFLLEKHLIQRK